MNFKIAAEANVQADYILLVQCFAVEAFKADIILVHQVGKTATGRPYLRAAVTDVNQFEFHARMPLAFFRDVIRRLHIAFNKHIHANDLFFPPSTLSIIAFFSRFKTVQVLGTSIRSGFGLCRFLTKVGNDRICKLRGIYSRFGFIAKVAGVHAVFECIKNAFSIITALCNRPR